MKRSKKSVLEISLTNNPNLFFKRIFLDLDPIQRRFRLKYYILEQLRHQGHIVSEEIERMVDRVLKSITKL